MSEGVFISRPNRFIANVELEGAPRVCHVKNTGRCGELLLPGTRVWVQRCDVPTRKTKYDLITVQKGDRLINMDSAAPNAVFGEYLAAGGLIPQPELIRPETVYGDSRFDFYLEGGSRRAFCEVKGVTLEEDGVVRFPDAPTQRGVKHLLGLQKCVEAGFEAYAVFIVQMEGAKYFEPNYKTHRLFGEELCRARSNGVGIICLDCRVTPDSLSILGPIPFKLYTN